MDELFASTEEKRPMGKINNSCSVIQGWMKKHPSIQIRSPNLTGLGDSKAFLTLL